NPLQIMELNDKEKKAGEPKELKVDQLNFLSIICPFAGCMSTILSSDILFHVLVEHLRPPTSTEEELNMIFEGERSVLNVDLSQLKPQKTILLGVLLYGAKRDDPNSLPGIRGLCPLNRFTPKAKEAEVLAAYLPVLVLVRRCYFFDWLNKQEEEDPNGGQEDVIHRGEESELDMFLFWTQSAYCTRPMHITMTLYDRTMSECRSGVRQVANSGMIHPELKGKQLPKSKHALWITCSEMAQMGKGKGGDTKNVILECILHEDIN
ncbi:hypothetical protein KR074_006211, partial [Drosophila pseudoananassae]